MGVTRYDETAVFVFMCPIAIAYSMGQIIKSVYVCQCVCVGSMSRCDGKSTARIVRHKSIQPSQVIYAKYDYVNFRSIKHYEAQRWAIRKSKYAHLSRSPKQVQK